MSIDLGAVPVTGFISPTDNEDTYATHKAEYGKGGYRVVVDIEARDAISQDRRELGMLVYVLSDNRLYQLLAGIDNEHWVISEIIPHLPEDYIFKGNDLGVAEASPALIDINLEIISINEKIDDLIAGAADNITLTGAVTGTGTGTITTTLTDITSKQVSDFAAAVKTEAEKLNLNQFLAPTSTLNMNSQIISNVGFGSSASDAASISRVDGIVNSAIAALGAVTSIIGGTGITVTGSAPDPTISITLPRASIYTYDNILTNVLTANVAQKVNLDVNSFEGVLFTDGSSEVNKAVYTGSTPLECTLYGLTETYSTIANINVGYQLAINGSVIDPSFKTRLSTANQPITIPIWYNILYLDPGDYVEVYVVATSNTTVTVKNIMWEIKAKGY